MRATGKSDIDCWHLFLIFFSYYFLLYKDGIYLQVLNLIHSHVEWSQGTIETINNSVIQPKRRNFIIHFTHILIILYTQRKVFYCQNTKKQLSDSNG